VLGNVCDDLARQVRPVVLPEQSLQQEDREEGVLQELVGERGVLLSQCAWIGVMVTRLQWSRVQLPIPVLLRCVRAEFLELQEDADFVACTKSEKEASRQKRQLVGLSDLNDSQQKS